MTSAGPSAKTLGGFALVGVGALAAVFGVATLVSGESSNSAQPPPPAPESSVATKSPGDTPPPPETSGMQLPGEDEPQPPVPAPRPEKTPPAPAPPPPAEQQPPPQAGPDRPEDRVVVRIYNNSTVKGLAHRAAADFRGVGYDVAEVGNYAQGRIYTTTVYYRPGTPEEEQARFVAEQFNARVEPRFPGLAEASGGVIAIVTNDYNGPKDGK